MKRMMTSRKFTCGYCNTERIYEKTKEKENRLYENMVTKR